MVHLHASAWDVAPPTAWDKVPHGIDTWSLAPGDTNPGNTTDFWVRRPNTSLKIAVKRSQWVEGLFPEHGFHALQLYRPHFRCCLEAPTTPMSIMAHSLGTAGVRLASAQFQILPYVVLNHLCCTMYHIYHPVSALCFLRHANYAQAILCMNVCLCLCVRVCVWLH